MLSPDPVTDSQGGFEGFPIILVLLGLAALGFALFTHFRGENREWASWQLVGGAFAVAALIGGGTLLATGGGSERGDSPDPGQSYYGGVLPDDGVRLELADGASMFIPRTAFQESVANAIGTVLDPADVPPGPTWAGPTIAAWDFRVDGGIAEPVEVRLPKPDGSFALVHYHDGAYQLVPFRVEGDALVAWLDRLSITATKRIDFDALINEIDQAEETARDDPVGAVEDLFFPEAACDGRLAGSRVEFDPAVDRLVDICVRSSESFGSYGDELITVHNRRSFFVTVRPIEEGSVDLVRAEMRAPEGGWLIGPDMKIDLKVGNEDLGGRAVTFDVGIDVDSISTTAIGFFLQQAGILEPVMQTAAYVADHGLDEAKADTVEHLRRRMAQSEEEEAEGKLADVLSDEIVEKGASYLSWLLNLGGVHPPDESDAVEGLEKQSIDLAMASAEGIPRGKVRVYLDDATVPADEAAEVDVDYWLTYGESVHRTSTESWAEDRVGFTGQAGDTIRVRMVAQSGDLEPYVEILDAIGVLLDADAFGELTFQLPADGTYIIIATGGNTGDYLLTLDQGTDGQGDATGPASIACNSWADSEIAEIGEVKNFTFGTMGGEVASLYAIPQVDGLDLQMELRAGGSVVAVATIPPEFDGTPTIDDLPLTWLGTYVVAVWSETGTGAFELQLDCEDAEPIEAESPAEEGPPPADDGVIDIAYGGTEVRNARSDGTRVYRFSGFEGEYVRADAYAMDGLSLALGLLDAGGGYLASSTEVDEWGYVTIWDYELPTTGTYYLEAYSDTGPVGRHQVWLERMEFDWPLIYELYGSCADGDLDSCDVLTWSDMAPVGSDYEWFGLTCGGRLSQPMGWQSGPCSDLVPDSPPPDDEPPSIRPEPVLSTGDVQVTLRWSGEDALHLAVLDPQNLWTFGHTADGPWGYMDVVAPAECMGDAPRVENVYYPAAPEGTYSVDVNHNPCGSGSMTSFELTITVDGQVVSTRSGVIGNDVTLEDFAEFQYP